MKNQTLTIEDDRTNKEKVNTLGFVVATDKFMSGWGGAKDGRSLIAVPFVSEEDKTEVLTRIKMRKEMKRVRIVYGNKYAPKMSENDHLHIYNTTRSFRYALTSK